MGGVVGAPSQIITDDVEDFSIGRGTQYYNAAGLTLPYTDTAEKEIGTITAVTKVNTDSVWLQASLVVTNAAYISTWKSGSFIPIQFRIRRDSLTGTLVAGALTVGSFFITQGAFYDSPPIILLGSDVPGGTAGNHVYKLTAQLTHASDSGSNQGIVGYRLLLGQAKSK